MNSSSDLNAALRRADTWGFYVGPNKKHGGITIGGCRPGGSYNECTKAFENLPEITSVGAKNTDLADDGLERICRFSNLRDLDVINCRTTGAGLASLTRLNKLEVLNLTQVAGIDEAMQYVAQLKTLRDLTVLYCDLTDTGLAQLKDMPALERLRLTGTKVVKAFEGLQGSLQLKDLGVEKAPVTDAGAAVLSRLPSLERLILSETKITDRGLTEFGSLDALFWLTLGKTAITDSGLAHLTGCANLHELWLDVHLLTPAGIEHLTRFPNLTKLLVKGDKYDPALAARVERALPNCYVNWLMPDSPQTLGAEE